MYNDVLFEERLANFQPEPLVPLFENKDVSFEIPAVKEEANSIDLAKVNYLNFLNNNEIKKASEDAIRQYGMGTCGPRAFYGTIDLHLDLEERFAKFLGTEDSALYAYGFVALSASTAFYVKYNDTIFIDEEINVPLQQGIRAGRGNIIKFAHNDVKDFRAKVTQAIDQRKKKNSSRRFLLILEAISWHTGKVCPLPDFLAVAEEFKIRVILEESYSLGVLGTTGRGLTEYYDINPNRIDYIIGTFEGAFGSTGGFCASSHLANVEVQRLASTGYMFSASLPTYLAKAVLKALELLEDKPKTFSGFTKKFHTFLKEECGFNVISDPQSPFKVIKNKPQGNQKIHEYCKEKGVHFICSENGLTIHLNMSLLDNTDKLEELYEVFKGASKLIDECN